MKMLRYAFYLFFFVSMLQARPEKPNFVLILADDLGWQDLKCYDTEAPFSVFESPNLDALAADGILFRQGYAPAPTCAPSRSGIMSGRFPARVDNTHVIGGEVPKPHNNNSSRIMDPYYSARLELEEITIPEALAPHGYYSGHFGKWHMAVGHNAEPGALSQGFDVTSNTRGVHRAMTDRLSGFATTDPADPYQLDANGFAYDQLTEDAIGFLQDATTNADPFFCYYASWLVHVPIQVRTESLLQKYAGLMGYSYPLSGSEIFAEGQNNPYYAAMVETLDYNVGRIVDYLKNTDDPRWPGHKLIENTYIIFTSDNGGKEVTGTEGITDNFPLDKGKTHAEEGGIRVPFIVAGGEIPSGITSEVMINGLDIYPTILSLAGLPLPGRLDGVDLSDLLLSDAQDPTLVKNPDQSERDTMYWHYPHRTAFHSVIRKGGYKLFKEYDYLDNPAIDPYRLYELYDTNDVRTDIEEMNDINASEAVLVQTLSTELETWLSDVNASVPHYNPNYTGTLTNKGNVPQVLASGDSNSVAWVTFETDKAEVVKIELIYTLDGGHDEEEWFDLDVPFIFADGTASIPVPAGTTHYVFNLIDENNFLVSSVNVGEIASNTGGDSTRVPAYFDEPSETATIQYFGTTLPTSSVVMSQAHSELNGAPVNNDGGDPIQSSGQTFTLTKTTELTALTLQVAKNYTFSAGSKKMLLWIGEYGGATTETLVYEWIDFDALSFTALEYYTINFQDTIFTPGKYAFQLTWSEYGAEHDITWRRANGSGDLAGGERLYESEVAPGVVSVPFASPAADDVKDLVFALHGQTINYLNGFTAWGVSKSLPVGQDGAEDDPDRDGFKNLLEYSFGTDPMSFTAANYWSIGTDPEGASWDLQYTYLRRKDAASRGLTYEVQRSTDLSIDSWSSQWVTETAVSSVDSEFESVTTRVEGSDSVFVRMKITGNE
ncbi:sulfatase [Puniceicoccales bacterium CK1056]|uniref:Sulfatase n=1 Tax=Oceanipulchritudo coccoides TaxID=2706888 RepID=A0A6B2M0Y7_9BACT|nr:sulfatase [Oceanipulchritudo coccoides]NDV62062.1 sulfatase [Oceanipulchritudo coccoides]